MTISDSALDQVRWNEQGLVPAIAQDAESGTVLMVAWMSRESLAATVAEGRAVYWSRSRQALWRKGESSGHVQHVAEVRLDCDSDTLLLQVRQEGGIACHTGRQHCFMYRVEGDDWKVCEPVLKDPSEIY
jgi:phosphoribosyl-AMP cyclohydrolase